MTLQENAPAKVNLFLEVTGKRADGYHELRSLVIFTDFGDVVTIELATETRLVISGPQAANLSTGKDNLILKAASLYHEVTGSGNHYSFTLDKRIPVAAGLGGGSADAAAVLRLLCRLDNRDQQFIDEVIPAICRNLGADVLMCFHSRTSLVGGIGDVIEKSVQLPFFHILLANPMKELSTADVFRNLKVTKHPARLPVGDETNLKILSMYHNDLTESACQLVPEIDELIDMIMNQPGCRLARMSGSGATCFGIFDNWEEASAARMQLLSRWPNYWSATTSPI